MPEGKDIAALQMDTALPLGNSQDVFNRRALHVKIGNKLTEPIPVTITTGTTGTPYFANDSVVTSPGVDVLVLSDTVDVTTRQYSRIALSCSVTGLMDVLLDGDLIASRRTGPSNPNAEVIFSPMRVVSNGSTLEVNFKARTGSPIVDVEADLQALDIT